MLLRETCRVVGVVSCSNRVIGVSQCGVINLPMNWCCSMFCFESTVCFLGHAPNLFIPVGVSSSILPKPRHQHLVFCIAVLVFCWCFLLLFDEVSHRRGRTLGFSYLTYWGIRVSVSVVHKARLGERTAHSFRFLKETWRQQW